MNDTARSPRPAPRRKPGTPPGRSRAGGQPARPADTSPGAGRVLEWLLDVLPVRHRDRARHYLILTRMDRPIGILLLLWPTWWALWLASEDFPAPRLLVIFTLGVIVMRAAGCAINDYADRELDPKVARTAGRPIASGLVQPREALGVFAILLVSAFVLVLFTNRLTIMLSLGGALLAACYPFAKRYTYLPQVVLGAAYGWSIPMAFAAVHGAVSPLGWLLYLANLGWTVMYDTQYAMLDREDDLRAGAKSTAILFGDADLPILAILCGTFLFAMSLLGQRLSLGLPYWLALAAVAGQFGWQLWSIRGRAPSACFAAFKQNHWVGMTIWIGFVFAFALK